LLFEIGGYDPDGGSNEHKTHLDKLISGGYVTMASNETVFCPSAGLNDS
jgi:hypothetical protein